MARYQSISTLLSTFRRLSNSSSHIFDASCFSGQASTSAPTASSGFNSLLQQLRRAASQSAASSSSSTAGASAAAASALPKRVPKNSLLNDLKQLSKFRLSSLVVLTAGAGFVAGSGEVIDWRGFAWTSLGTFGAAACANTLNQLYEIKNDSQMTRTMNRPLPAGRMKPIHAAMFAVTMGAIGLGILHFQTNAQTTALGAANIFLYACVYTPLKQMTIYNTWVGAVVGALPPLMGWAAASGQLDVGASVLAAALFSWQMPHFLALAWLCKEDYIRGGHSMLSKFDAVGRRSAIVSLRHCLYLVPIGMLAVMAEVTTSPFAWEAAALAVMFGAYAARFAAAPSQQSARKMFRASLLYLPLLMLGFVVHRMPNTHTVDAESVCAKARSMVAEYPWMLEAAAAVEDVGAGLMGMGSGIRDQLLVSKIKCPSKVLCDSDSGEARQSGDPRQASEAVIGAHAQQKLREAIALESKKE